MAGKRIPKVGPSRPDRLNRPNRLNRPEEDGVFVFGWRIKVGTVFGIILNQSVK